MVCAEGPMGVASSPPSLLHHGTETDGAAAKADGAEHLVNVLI